MTLQETLTQLEKLGTDKMREFNRKHGAHDNQYGLKMGDIRALAKKIKTNHALALELWNTGNIDARLLATLIIQPEKLSHEELNAIVKSERYSQVTDRLYSHVIKDYPDHEIMRNEWMSSDHPMCLRAGWSLTSGRIARNPGGLDIPALLERIAAEMPAADPEVQWTMNSALAQIGIHHPEYRERALALGEAMGIYRNYPVSKGCTSPFAPIWINEMVRRQAAGTSDN
ncbi:DNA alkylation repair protein [Dyadobacter sandarakinus]|uniref:DNA alkylation repair protein n=1 Tax=Dyadobacter sandarakinus TaxID=2747268 RepID=A0ABX7ID75_9BACT|nr:DNA alkylation repair protein [Dyadobacter sandarakinus]